MKYWIGVLVCLGCVAVFSQVSAVGVQVKPTEISLEQNINQQVETEILVVNVTQETSMYRVFLDDYQEEVLVEPANFQLEGGENQIVKIISQIEKRGNYQTNVSVVARPMGAGGLVAASGVKVPIVIDVFGFSSLSIFVAIFGLLLVCLIVIFVVKLRMSSKTRIKVNIDSKEV